MWGLIILLFIDMDAETVNRSKEKQLLRIIFHKTWKGARLDQLYPIVKLCSDIFNIWEGTQQRGGGAAG